MTIQYISKLKWWQIAAVALAVSFIGGLSSLLSSKKEKALYIKELEQAPWAPPSWLFGPAWTINNFFLLLALQQLLNDRTGNNKKLLRLQLFIWVIYFSFGYVYFNKKSPLLASIWTVTDAVLATSSFLIAYKENKKLSGYYIPLSLWTLFASTLAIYQAVNNRDPFLKVEG